MKFILLVSLVIFNVAFCIAVGEIKTWGTLEGDCRTKALIGLRNKTFTFPVVNIFNLNLFYSLF